MTAGGRGLEAVGEASAASSRSREKLALAERVASFVREVYGAEARVDLVRESFGWRGEVWRSPSGFLWSLPSDSADRSVVLGKIETSLAAMIAGTARCRYCPRSIPAGYDGTRPCIMRPKSPSNRRYACVP
jgi:hypothetical protein